MATAELSIDALQHQLAARNKISQIILGLYRHAVDFPKVFHKPDFQQAHSLFAGAAFSMWRAAFLTNDKSEADAVHKDCVNFLKTLARDNAINFAQDRDMSNWSVGYYHYSAFFRLQALAKFDLFKNDKQLQKFAKIHASELTIMNGKFSDTTKEWDLIQRHLESSYFRFLNLIVEEHEANYATVNLLSVPTKRRRSSAGRRPK